MSTMKRLTICALAAVVVVGMSWEAAASCKGHNTEPCQEKPGFPCKDKIKASGGLQASGGFRDAREVWWGDVNRSYGNYLQFDKAVIPAKRAEAKAKAQPIDPDFLLFGPIYFDLDKSDLRPDGLKVAQRVLRYMRQNPKKQVCIEGHCCDLATNPYNMALGKRRAEAVKKYLVDQGIDKGRIETVSFGEEKRVTTTPEERELNRRAMVVVRIRTKG